MSEYLTNVVEVPGGRKRKSPRKKSTRYTEANAGVLDIVCSHAEQLNKKHYCSVAMLTLEDLEDFRKLLYLNSTKESQDAFLLKYMKVSAPKRHRVDPDTVRCPKNVSVKYEIRKTSSNEPLQICAKSFQSITGVSRDRLARIARLFLETGQTPKERK